MTITQPTMDNGIKTQQIYITIPTEDTHGLDKATKK